MARYQRRMTLASSRLRDTEALKVDPLHRGRRPGGIELDGHGRRSGADEHDPGDDDGDLAVYRKPADGEGRQSRGPGGGPIDDVAVEERRLRGAHGSKIERETGADVP